MRTIAIPVGRIAYPPGPMPAEPAPRVRRLPVPVRMPSPFAGNGTANTAERNWNLQNDSMTLPDPELRQWEPARFNAVPVIAFKPPAATGRGTAQYLLAPFVPQDTPCGVTFNVGQNGSKDQKR